MARPYWSGQVQISLVSFGVKLFVATEAKNEIRFHQIDRASGERVRYQKTRASAAEASPDEVTETVQQSDIVKGYEYTKGQYVTIETEELARLRVPSKHTMEITQFVREADVDPEFYEKPYFVVPDADTASEAFLTVREAMLKAGRIGITKIAFGGREHVVALAPAGTDEQPGMMAYTMRYAAELRSGADYFRDVKKTAVDADSLQLATELIQRKAGDFDPSKFVDGYEVAVKELVDAKLKHLPVPQDEVPAPVRGKVVNLMDALRKSVGSVGETGETVTRTAKPAASSKPAAASKSAASSKPSGSSKSAAAEAKLAAAKAKATGPVLVKSTGKTAKADTKPAAKTTARRKSA